MAPLVLGVLLAAGARADDWPQFRKDAFRTASSTDKIPCRVAELWTWDGWRGPLGQQSSAGYQGSRPLGAPVVWKGRVLFVSLENNRPHLICADQRNGMPVWRQPLNGYSGFRPDVGPAVDGRGNVYAYDTSAPLSEGQTRTTEVLDRERNKKKYTTLMQVTTPHVRLRAFSGLNGSPVGEQILPGGFPKRGLNSLITRLFLNVGPEKQVVELPGRTSHWRLAEYPALGPPLVAGREVRALSSGDLLVRWSPGSVGTFYRIAYKDSPYFELTAPAEFLGFPMALTGAGTLIADDRGHRFIANFQGPRVNWWQDWDWTIGVPGVEGALIFVNAGGPGAYGSVFALQTANGLPRWNYGPAFLPPDPSTPFDDKWIVPLVDHRPVAPDEGFVGTWKQIFPAGPWPYYPPVKRITLDSDNYEVHQPHWQSITGHQENVGVVVHDGRVYARAAGNLVSLEQNSGKPLWTRPYPAYAPLTGLVGVKDHLILCQGTGNFPRTEPRLQGIRKDNGKLEWELNIPQAGQLITANSLLYVGGDGHLVCYAPAERTYHLAVDSNRKEDYRPDPDELVGAADGGEGAAPDPPAPSAAPPALRPGAAGVDDAAAKAPPLPKQVASATILRLQWGTPLPQLLEQARARKAAAPDVPLVLVLDWLSSTRGRRRGTNPDGPWSPAQVEEFVEACRQLAASVRPEHFELASDLNVYLAHYPGQVDSIRALLRSARAAVRQVSSKTQTLVSFNVEVLSDNYERTPFLPFEKVRRIGSAERKAQLSLLEEVDAVGLTTLPQAAFLQAQQLPRQYFTALRLLVGSKSLLVTRIGVRYDPKAEVPAQAQAAFLKRLLQSLYWADAQVVAYPDLQRGGDTGAVDLALQVGQAERQALPFWKEYLNWKKVKKLTAEIPDPVTPLP